MNRNELTDGARNILATYFLATPEERVDGREWYPRARRIAEEISGETGVSVHKVAGVISATSPQVSWDANPGIAAAICRAFDDGAEGPPKGLQGFPVCHEKAWRILQGPEGLPGVMEHFDPETGPKTRAFALCVMAGGECTAVCVDGHAVAIREGTRFTTGDPRAKLWAAKYRRVAEDYRLAAKFAGETPSAMQAITWTVWRKIHGVG